jgi:hypothetical protein
MFGCGKMDGIRIAHATGSRQGVVFACEAEGTMYTFRLLIEQAILTSLCFLSYVPERSI